MTQKKPASVTTVESLKGMNASTPVELPGWEPGQNVTFRLRRTSLRGLVKAGKIPNPLLAAAQRLYEGQNSRASAKFDDLVKVMTIVVDNALVEPKLSDLEAEGIDLTEEQFGLIWAYAQKGIAALEAFRKVSGNPAGGKNSEAVEDPAE